MLLCRRTETDGWRPPPPDESQHTLPPPPLDRMACVRRAGRVSHAKPLSPIRRSPLQYHVWTIAPRRSRIRSTLLKKAHRRRRFAQARAHTTHTHTHTPTTAHTVYKTWLDTRGKCGRRTISEFLTRFLVLRCILYIIMFGGRVIL